MTTIQPGTKMILKGGSVLVALTRPFPDVRGHMKVLWLRPEGDVRLSSCDYHVRDYYEAGTLTAAQIAIVKRLYWQRVKRSVAKMDRYHNTVHSVVIGSAGRVIVVFDYVMESEYLP